MALAYNGRKTKDKKQTQQNIEQHSSFSLIQH